MAGRTPTSTSDSGRAIQSALWEDNVLIVDTRNFEDHRSPYQTGVPSGARKHVVERCELSEDCTHILLEFMLDDPEYFVAPMTYST